MARSRSLNASRIASAMRCGSGLARRTLVSTRLVKCSLIQARPVNWARWVNSCSSTQVRNSSGSKPNRLLHARPGWGRPCTPHRHRRCAPDQQVVLAEHPGAHPAEQRTQLGADHLAADAGGEALGRDLHRPLLDRRDEQVLERRDVGSDPRRPVDDLDDRGPGKRAQSGGLFDLILETRDRCPRSRRTREVSVLAMAAGDVGGDLLGASPVDRRLSGCHGEPGLLFPVPLRRGTAMAVTFLR